MAVRKINPAFPPVNRKPFVGDPSLNKYGERIAGPPKKTEKKEDNT